MNITDSLYIRNSSTKIRKFSDAEFDALIDTVDKIVKFQRFEERVEVISQISECLNEVNLEVRAMVDITPSIDNGKEIISARLSSECINSIFKNARSKIFELLSK